MINFNYVMFPFEKLEKGSKIAVYGAGEIGINFKKQLESNNFCEIVCFIDKNALKIKNVEDIVCDTLINLNSYSFDYLVIASIAYKEEIYEEILRSNTEKTLDMNKIILLEEKNNISIVYNSHKPNTPDGDWRSYYQLAESSANSQFNKYILPILKEYNNLDSQKSTVVDFACGHGRIADKVRLLCKKIICCDISEEAIEFCKDRFKEFSNVDYIINKLDKINLQDSSCDLIYSWDAMVHFSYKLLDIYTDEFYRILKSNSYAIIHHSNLADATDVEFKSDMWCDNPGFRSNVSAKDYAYIAQKHGFKIIKQTTIDWGIKDLDCITVLKKE